MIKTHNNLVLKLILFVILSLAMFAMISSASYVNSGEAIYTIGRVDVKPGSCPNAVNFNSKGVLPVAIYGDTDFDVATVIPNTIMFGPRGEANVSPIKINIGDANFDGYPDLIFHFSIPELKPLFLDLINGDDDGFVESELKFSTFTDDFIYNGDDGEGLWLKIPGFK